MIVLNRCSCRSTMKALFTSYIQIAMGKKGLPLTIAMPSLRKETLEDSAAKFAEQIKRRIKMSHRDTGLRPVPRSVREKQTRFDTTHSFCTGRRPVSHDGYSVGGLRCIR